MGNHVLGIPTKSTPEFTPCKRVVRCWVKAHHLCGVRGIKRVNSGAWVGGRVLWQHVCSPKLICIIQKCLSHRSRETSFPVRVTVLLFGESADMVGGWKFRKVRDLATVGARDDVNRSGAGASYPGHTEKFHGKVVVVTAFPRAFATRRVHQLILQRRPKNVSLGCFSMIYGFHHQLYKIRHASILERFFGTFDSKELIFQHLELPLYSYELIEDDWDTLGVLLRNLVMSLAAA
mmetsp:Transcript_72086/g.141402  ORF Transcript_72086/g.141402 Transcript_72086/m.141402 type:complete len:234 (+) Transcript_72086:411-1112(+)